MRLSRILPIAAVLGLGAWAIRKLIRARSADAASELPFDEDAEILIIEEEIVPLH